MKLNEMNNTKKVKFDMSNYEEYLTKFLKNLEQKTNKEPGWYDIDRDWLIKRSKKVGQKFLVRIKIVLKTLNWYGSTVIIKPHFEKGPDFSTDEIHDFDIYVTDGRRKLLMTTLDQGRELKNELNIKSSTKLHKDFQALVDALFF